MPEKMVRVLDSETGNKITIPARELAPGMVQVVVQDEAGGVVEDGLWVDATKLHQGTIRHPPFPEEVRALIRQIQDAFYDVRPLSFEEWEHGFRCDQHPDQEIAIWLHMVTVFKQFTDGRDYELYKRKVIFDVIVACANNGKEHVLMTVESSVLSKKRLREIVDAFFGDDAPGSVN